MGRRKASLGGPKRARRRPGQKPVRREGGPCRVYLGRALAYVAGGKQRVDGRGRRPEHDQPEHHPDDGATTLA